MKKKLIGALFALTMTAAAMGSMTAAAEETKTIGVVVWNPEDVFSFVARDYFMLVLRVEVLQLFQRSTCHLTYLPEMKHLVDLESVNMYRKFYCSRTHSVLFVVFHCVQSTDKCRSVSSGLPRQEWPYVPEGSAASTSADGSVYVSSAAII